jgi:threonine dehydratase
LFIFWRINFNGYLSLRFAVTVSDRPGGIADLCKLISGIGVSIKDIMHERAWLKDIYSVSVKVFCETSDWNHSQQLKKLLLANYKNVSFSDVPMAIKDEDLAL